MSVLVAAGMAQGQGISGLTITKNAGNSANFFEDTLTLGRERTTTVATVSSSASSFTTRYAEVVGVDAGAFTSGSLTQATDYRVNFNVTAPGAYTLGVVTTLSGALTVVDDGDGPATADITGVTGSHSGGTLSGSLSIADPGIRSSAGNTGFGPTANATISGTSNGAAQAHQLSFTWSASCSSSNGFLTGGDECAVRLGIPVSYGGESAGDYPGSGGRVQANDGHFVAVTFTSLCGNAVVDAGVGEQCDEGPLNGLGGSCCTLNCQFRPLNDVCRLATAGCDQQEVCTGSSGSCPADGVKTVGTICRAGSAGEICDITETCDGVNAECPPDAVEPASTVCRGVAGVCDLAENCTGASKFCPADAKSTAVCRASAGVCDLADSCNGVSNDCPADAKSTAVCRASAGFCDLADSCNGVGNDCPADAKRNPFFVCRGSAGACDSQETCDGMTNDCPADAKSTAVCRASAGSCDVAESCDGVNDTCPSDQFQPSSTVCRAAILFCDVAENCTGSGAACPPDAVDPSGTVCPGDGNVCTVDECDGVNKNCQHPAGNAGTICRAGTPGQVCDITETCDGVNTACPADDVQTSGTPCTDDGNVCTVDECDGASKYCQHPAGNAGATCRAGSPGEECDVDEQCDGVNTSCPADDVESLGTPCTDDGNVCTVDECDGASKFCQHPAGNAGTECRADAGECDVAEQCNGVSPTCPANGFEPSGTPCTADAEVCTADECDGAGSCAHPAGNAGTICRAATPGGVCDVDEVCDGVSTTCPPDAVEPNTTVCRADAGECDVAEMCDGAGKFCPPDGFETDGTPCTDDGMFCTGTETCQGGSCTGSGDPCTVGSCDEIANECVGCAVAPQAGCGAALKSIFLVKDNSDDSKDKVIFKWIKGDQTDKIEFADPKTTADYNLCVYSGASEDLIAEALVPPSASLWSEKTNGYKYRDTGGTKDGIQKIILKAGAQGKAKALIKGKGMGLPDLPPAANSSLDIDLPVRVQLVNTDNGQCFEGTFDSSDIRKNEPGKFKGKAQ